jgi:hypothetical protein
MKNLSKLSSSTLEVELLTRAIMRTRDQIAADQATLQHRYAKYVRQCAELARQERRLAAQTQRKGAKTPWRKKSPQTKGK